MIRIIGEFIACIVVGLFIAFALLGWFYKCGETYVDAQGARHVVKCEDLW